MSQRTSSKAMRRAAYSTLSIGIVAFAVLVAAVQLGLTESFDRIVVLSLRNPEDLSDAWGPVWFQKTAAELTALGGYPIVVLAVVIVLSALLIARKNAAAVFLALTLISGSVVSSLLKLFFNRARPDLVDRLDQTFTSSFPSAHAMLSMIAWLTLAAIAIRFIEMRRLRIYVLVAAMTLALIIGSTRVYLGVHWPSDVIAGWAIGLAWASGSWLVADKIARRLTGGAERNEELGRSG
uniref:phosphatase PAP2 family protein n=1 Tax=Pararhizobium sp. IMCC3301 TaxID=3067904 RepID=UPI0027408A9E|nr:phosphatase PAP2 family protein [Pararhizobium sp. IMCC3301]